MTMSIISVTYNFEYLQKKNLNKTSGQTLIQRFILGHLFWDGGSSCKGLTIRMLVNLGRPCRCRPVLCCRVRGVVPCAGPTRPRMYTPSRRVCRSSLSVSSPVCANWPCISGFTP